MPRRTGWRAAALRRLARTAPALPRPLLLGARPAAAAVGSLLGARRVAWAMRAALGEVPASAPRAYFRRLADRVAFSLLIHARGLKGARLEEFCEIDPAAEGCMADALARGKGAILAVPHLAGCEVLAGLVGARVPLAILARRSADPEYQALKEAWYRALGVDVVWRPKRGTGKGLEEMLQAVRVLRRGTVLAITPDLLRAPGTGVPVEVFGRRAELPAGAFALAVQTRTPLVSGFFHAAGPAAGGKYRLALEPPLPAEGEDREAAIRCQAQAWATLFEAFVRAHPDMWEFWLDKRWRRWLLEAPSCG